MISMEKSGGKTVYLFIPFDHGKQRIDSIAFSPLRFGHVLNWGRGEYKDMLDLMVDLAGVDIAIIKDLRYPDTDRVIEAFMTMLTPEIRNDIAEGTVPQKAYNPNAEEHQEERVTNGSGERTMIPPGTPLPPEMQAGFDMGEEP